MCPKDKTGPQKADKISDISGSGPWEQSAPQTDEKFSATGSPNSTGHPGEPSPSDPDAPETVSRSTYANGVGVSMVRRHNGRFTISVGLLTCYRDLEPATFIVLKGGALGDALTVTLCCELTRSQWQSLERALTMPGDSGSVVVKFEPTTENLVPPTTSPST